MKKKMKYSSEGIPFPPEMGMDEDEENFIFYESIAWKQGKKILEGKLNKKTGVIELFYNEKSINKFINFLEEKNMIDFNSSKGKNTSRKELKNSKIFENLKMHEAIRILSIATCYVHYKHFMSQWKINPN